MPEAKSSKHSSWRSAWSYATILGAAALSACVFFDPKTGGNKGVDMSNSTPFFLNNAPLPEDKSWNLESGIEQSALGDVDPIFFDVGKSPLRFPGSKIAFNLFENVTLLAIVDNVKGVGNGVVVTSGHIAGFEDATFLITTYGTMLTGSVHLGSAGHYNVSIEKGGKYRVAKLNNYLAPETEAPEVNLPGPSVADLVLKKSAAGASEEGAQATRRIDLFVMYDTAAKTDEGSDSIMLLKINAAIAEANNAYVLSKIDAELNLVGTKKVNYAESYILDTNLLRLKNHVGVLDSAGLIRDSLKADIVTLIVDSATGGYAGLGYVMTTADTSFRSYAYNVLVNEGLTAGWYTLAHEIGHNMGCQHDSKTTKTKGAYTYSHGWTFKGMDKAYYATIMSYGNATSTRIPFFSNPLVKYNGVATGTATANNAKTIGLTAPIIANFKGTDTAAVASITYPTDSLSVGGKNLMIQASITDDAGIDSAVFFDSTGMTATRLGRVTSEPWQFLATNLDSADYRVYVKVYDRGGHTTISSKVFVRMGITKAKTGWSETFVGSAGRNGVVVRKDSAAGDTISIRATARGFYQSMKTDAFQFVYKTLTGNGSITAKVRSVSSVSGNGLAGLMVRDTSGTDGASNVFLGVNYDGDLTLATRAAAKGATTVKTLSTTTDAPVWLKLIRKGTAVTLYTSSTGTDWTYWSKSTVGGLKTTPVRVGMVVTSQDSLTTDSASFTGFATDTSANNPPAITVTGAVSGAEYAAGDSVTLTATVTDLDGATTISKVKFFQHDSLIATDSVKPYIAKFAVFKDSLSKFIARAYDKSGDSNQVTMSSIYVHDTTGVTLAPSKDTYVRDGTKYTNVNYGTAANFFVRGSATAGNKFRSQLSFALTNARIDTVVSAKLRLFGYQSASDTDTVKVAVYAVSDTSWVEKGSTGLKDATLADSTANPIDTIEITGSTQKWYEVNVTTKTRAAKVAGKSMISFYLKAINSTATMAAFNSKENTKNGAPQLYIHADTTGF